MRQHGKVYRHPLLILSLAPNNLPHNRYGFITGKRLGKAVLRNRVRRLLREAVRQVHPELQPGYDVVIIARSRIVGQSLAEVQRAVHYVFQQAKLTKDVA